MRRIIEVKSFSSQSFECECGNTTPKSCWIEVGTNYHTQVLKLCERCASNLASAIRQELTEVSP